ncbi:MAG: DUF6445 family protein, partial [Woeseiaceae bacterium]
MPRATIAANPDRRTRVQVVGREATPVIVIDDFALDASIAAGHARSSASFAEEQTSAYPGIRAALTREHVIATLDALYELLYRTYRIPARLRLRPQNAVYSLVSKPAADLTLSQSVPHFDSTRPHYIAVTHFLNDGAFGGTGLFRHRPTGFEKILADRLDEYVRSGEAFVRANGAPPPGY